ncbi:MAG: hypothetical protein ACE5LB_05665 [Acidiferrobacterales bacterium]
MMPVDHAAHAKTAATLLALATFGLLASAGTVDASLSCKIYAWRSTALHYRTTYEYSNEQTTAVQKQYKPLPKKGVYAVVRVYEIETVARETKPCRNLAVKKRLYLQRRDNPEFVLREINEFYAEDGTLITTNTQLLTEQLQRSGYYVASDPLPIPEDAPPGRYLLVSKLVLTKKGRSAAFLLAEAKTEYEILPLD